MRSVRYRLAARTIRIGLCLMPPGRFKTELMASIWVLNLRVQAHCAALNAAEAATATPEAPAP